MINYERHLKKVYSSDYNYTVDIIDNVVYNMEKYLQNEQESLESGGVLIGYKVKGKRHVVIEDLTFPDNQDYRSRFGFVRRAISHLEKIRTSRTRNSFCIGNWHTHPFDEPTPSSIDIDTWNNEIKSCFSSFHYQIYIICGKQGFRIWMGSERTKEIIELLECEILDGIYVRGSEDIE